MQGDLVGGDGLALSHPLFIWGGRIFVSLFPFGSLPWKLNLFSGIGAAVALANLFLLGWKMTKNIAAAALATMTLGLSHTFWWLSTIAEVYTWSVALLSVELLILFSICTKPNRKKFILLAFANGAGFSVHNLSLLTLPVHIGVLAYYTAKGKVQWDTTLWAGLAFLFGAFPILVLAAERFCDSGDLIQVAKNVFFGNHFEKDVLSIDPRLNLNLLKGNAALFSLNFLNPLWLCAIVGIRKLKTQVPVVFKAAIFSAFFFETLFFVRYLVPDQVTFSLPTLCILEVFCVFGLSGLIGAEKPIIRKITLIFCVFLILLAPVSYYEVNAFLHDRGISPVRSRVLPFRDEVTYWVIPWKQSESSAALFAGEALKTASPDGMIVADHTAFYPLVLLQKLNTEKNKITIIHSGSVASTALNAIGRRRLFVVSPLEPYTPPDLLKAVKGFKQTGPLFLACGIDL
jgi:hypothetical protein